MKLNTQTLIVGGIVLVAMAVEAVVIVMLMPPAATTAATGDGTDPKSETPAEEAPVVDEFAEVLVDSFNTTNNKVAPGSTIHLSFKVIGVVPEKQKLAFEENANKTHKTRVRQEIEKIARSARMEDLHDPSLNAIKRQIREAVNKILGKSYLTEVVINDFRLMEQ
jgi:flagellar basal body-associated protein FliL